MLLYSTKVWPLTSHVYHFEFPTLISIEVMPWSDLVSNEEICWKTDQLNILRTTAQCHVLWLSHVLMTTLPELSNILTRHLQTSNELASDHTAAGRMLSAMTFTKLIWCWRIF